MNVSRASSNEILHNEIVHGDESPDRIYAVPTVMGDYQGMVLRDYVCMVVDDFKRTVVGDYGRTTVGNYKITVMGTL
jgi:hypothetical protein